MENYVRKCSFLFLMIKMGLVGQRGAGGVDIAPTPDAPGSSVRPLAQTLEKTRMP